MNKCFAILFALLSGWATSSHAVPITYLASLSGSASSPPNASLGSGSGSAIYDPDAHTLLINLAFSGLLAPTTVAHIHCCTAVPMTGTIGVATPTPTFPGFPAGVTSGAYINALFDLTMATSFNAAFITASGGTPAAAEAALVAGLADGRAYFNIHTTAYPAGEIRGFLAAAPKGAPEPAALSLLGLGLVTLASARRRRPA